MLYFCLAVAFLFLIATIIITPIVFHKKGDFKPPLYTAIGGCFATVCTLIIPAMNATFITENKQVFFRGFMRLFLAVQNTLQVFTINIEAAEILESIKTAYGSHPFYLGFLIVMMVVSPILIAGFLLSFVKSVSDWVRIKLARRTDIYVFSELNEKSLALANNIINPDNDESDESNEACGSDVKKPRRATIIFTDVFSKNEEESYELLEKAKETKAICLKKDIVTLKIKPHSDKKLYLFAIGENETENVEQAVKLIEYYKNTDNVELYVFSTKPDGELILTKEDKGMVKVRRINIIKSMIYDLLYKHGKDNLFNDKELKFDTYGNKKISAVIVGMGKHGTEMLKALTWFCQMDGYSIEINAFDKDENAESIFAAKARDLLNPEYNGINVDGEAKYDIHIHSGVDVNTSEFADEINKIKDASYVFVSLGSDEDNIRVAAELRMRYKRMGIDPTIQAIVYNSQVKDALKNLVDFSNPPEEYHIEFVGGIVDTYKRNQIIMDSELVNDAKALHLEWGAEEDFWRFEYFFNSSMAGATYYKAHYKDHTKANIDDIKLQKTEHCRWNAYMRSEGFILKEKRNNIGKQHPNLKCFGDLDTKEQNKDNDIIEWWFKKYNNSEVKR